MDRYTEDHEYTRLGRIYHNMKTRCYNPNYDKYKYYGGKGIKVCDEWLESWYAFEDWAMENGYNDSLTLDRIDPEGNYSPENCRWISMKEQANNRTSNRMIEYNGETKSLQQWADILGIKAHTLSQRLDTGWSVEDAMTTPVHTEFGSNPITYNGVTLPMAEWSRRLGLSPNSVANRIARGWSVEDAVTKPQIRTKGWKYNEH